MKDIIPKLTSDRLWALIAYFIIVIANAKLNLGLDEKTMTEITYVAGAFILGKSLRGTSAGGILSAMIPGVAGQLLEVADDKPGKGEKKVAAAVGTASDVIATLPDGVKDDIADAVEKYINADAVEKHLKPPVRGTSNR
jgi:hypothetical protein